MHKTSENCLSSISTDQQVAVWHLPDGHSLIQRLVHSLLHTQYVTRPLNMICDLLPYVDYVLHLMIVEQTLYNPSIDNNHVETSLYSPHYYA
jgi:hypothetical protein